MYKAKVTSKGQVTIPKKLRKKLGIKSGDYIKIKETAQGYYIEKDINEDKIDRYVGILNKSTSTDKLIKELRGNDNSN